MMTKRASVALMLGALLVVNGCLTAETKIDDKGAGSMTLTYVAKPGTLEIERKKVEGPDVKIVSADQNDNRITFKITFDDVRKINTSPLFDRMTVTIADAPTGERELTAKILNKKPVTLPDETIKQIGKDVTLSLELPGPIVKTSAPKTAGNTVTWVIPTKDWLIAPEATLQVSYKTSGAAAAPTAPAAASPAKPAPSAK